MRWRILTIILGMAVLAAIAAADSLNMRQVGAVALPGTARALKILNSKAYIAMGQSGFAIVDIQDPANPVLLNTSYVAGTVRDIDIEGTIAGIACDDDRNQFRFYNVSDPTTVTPLV